MDSIKVTYEIRRHDSPNFHGWIIWECSDYMEEVYYQSTSLEEARAVMRDLNAQQGILIFRC